MIVNAENASYYLVVTQGREPQPGPLAGGGFQWSRSVSLVRDGEEISRAGGFCCTFAGDRPCEPFEENSRLAEMARPGDRVQIMTSRWGNDDFLREEEMVVASPMGERRRKRPQGCEPLRIDPLVRAAESRPFAAIRRRWKKEERLALLKATALARRGA